jgi:mannosyltransferase OCH1-like enzyme
MFYIQILYIILVILIFYILHFFVKTEKEIEYFQNSIRVSKKKIIEAEIKMLDKPFIPPTKNINSIIPLHIYLTWFTKDLPPKMKENVKLMKNENPEFQIHLYDDDDCRDFIKNNFNKDILNAYDSLIPGAYKADLWRYCILYKNGGIYIDIKYRCTNGFKFIYLTDKEYFCNDYSEKTFWKNMNTNDNGIYNALLICKPQNKILKKCIEQIVENVNNEFYGSSSLEPTGPLLMKKYFSEDEQKNLILNHYARNELYCIRYGLYKILEFYPGYRNEQQKFSNKKHYSKYWKQKNIYDKNEENKENEENEENE